MKKLLLACLAAVFVLAPSASALVAAGPTPYHAADAAPTGLHAFLLSPNEAPQSDYPRTPSFAWNPVNQKGGTYTFELATSRSFDESQVLFTYPGLKIPAVAIAHQLPWMTGVPYALWAHVRWQSTNGKIVTPWSQPFGFNMRWSDSDIPQQEAAPAGMIRWKPIEGATAYQVLYPELTGTTAFETTTNVADEREFFTLRNPPAEITWRVRAVRYIDDKDLLTNGLPRATYGPWSATFSSCTMSQTLPSATYVCPAAWSKTPTSGTPEPTGTISDTWDTSISKPSAHELTPGFSWTPTQPALDPTVASYEPGLQSLYRVYIFTDDHCVNQVFAGSVVGSPAYAPRTIGGPFQLPQSTAAIDSWETGVLPEVIGGEGNAYNATGDKVATNESPGSQVSANGPTNASGSAAGAKGAQVDLWDSGWPNGRYYWTVVPVEVEPYGPSATAAPGQGPSTLPVEYHDVAVPQDQCEASPLVGGPFGMSFGKVSQPVVTATGTPFVSGVAANGRFTASAKKVPAVHDSPLVAWEPAVGATTYEIQLSRKRYPWNTTWSTTTAATSYVLPLTKTQTGVWWYRVRGIDPALPSGAQNMTWSTPVSLRITGDSFVVVK
ncbi:MAG TPA: hypothetical protein VMH47_02625 [Gaiellaceae bacterium]|nr:hypothetical protein [Gaiellaceae bacterium]